MSITQYSVGVLHKVSLTLILIVALTIGVYISTNLQPHRDILKNANIELPPLTSPILKSEPKDIIQNFYPRHRWVYPRNVSGLKSNFTWDYKGRPSQGCYDNMNYRPELVFNCFAPIDVVPRMTLAES